MANRRCWSYRVGSKPYTVTVYERKPGGMLYARAWDPALSGGRGGLRRISLTHRDRAAAKSYASEQHARLVQGQSELRSGRISLARLFALYLEYRSPRKRAKERKGDARRARLFARVLGPDKEPMRITLAEWEAFIEQRRTGRLSARMGASRVSRDRFGSER